MNGKLEHFKARAKMLVGGRQGRKFPAELQRLGAEYANERRAAGCTWQFIADELDVSMMTLRRWCAQPPNAIAAFQRVAIVNSHRRETYDVSIGAVRIEGLDFDAIVALAKALS